MTYDSATDADGRYQAARDRAEIFMAFYEVELEAERLERAARRRAQLYRFLGLTSTR